MENGCQLLTRDFYLTSISTMSANMALDQAKLPDVSASTHSDDPDPSFQHEFHDLDAQCPAHTTERTLTRKIDLKILPILVVLYLMAFLDRLVICRNSSMTYASGIRADGMTVITKREHLQRPYSWSPEGPQTQGEPAQCGSHHIFHTLYNIRDTRQYSPKASETSCLAYASIGYECTQVLTLV